MKEILLIIFINVLIFCIVVYPFKLKGAVHINVLENVGFAVVKVFSFRLFSGRFKIAENGSFSIEREKKKKKKENKALKKHYFMCLAKRLELKKIEFFCDSGTDNNASGVALFSGYVNVIILSLLSILMSKYKHLKSFVLVQPNFKQDELKITTSAVVSFCLLDMLFSIICSLIYCKKKEKKVNG